MMYNELPKLHTIDISGCQQMIISVYDGYWVADGSGHYGFADIVVTEI